MLNILVTSQDSAYRDQNWLTKTEHEMHPWFSCCSPVIGSHTLTQLTRAQVDENPLLFVITSKDFSQWGKIEIKSAFHPEWCMESIGCTCRVDADSSMTAWLTVSVWWFDVTGLWRSPVTEDSLGLKSLLRVAFECFIIWSKEASSVSVSR